MENQDLLRLATKREANTRLVLLHGWGADADDLLMLGQTLAEGCRVSLDLVALAAPEPHPQGSGRQWYGLFPPAWDAVPAAKAALRQRLIALSEHSIPLQSTVVLGFSQGAAMALDAGCELPLAGVVACSGYPHPDWTPPMERPPVLLLHGRSDEVVPCQAAEELQRRLSPSEATCRLRTFDGGHTVPETLFPVINEALDSWLQGAGTRGLS